MKLKNRIGTVKSKRLSSPELATIRRNARNAVVHIGASEFSLNDIVLQSIRKGRRNSAVVASRIAASRSGVRKAVYKA
jgi:hypothetical protein